MPVDPEDAALVLELVEHAAYRPFAPLTGRTRAGTRRRRDGAGDRDRTAGRARRPGARPSGPRRRRSSSRKSSPSSRRPHRVALHPLVGLLARHAPRRPAPAAPTPEKTTPRSSSRLRRIRSGWTTMPATIAREAPQHVVERDEAVGQDDPLDRRVRDVALVPERDVLEGRHEVAAQHARQAHDLLAADRVALVRHRRRALLPLVERLLDLADLGLLQAADLEGELLERGGGDGERRHQLGVAVALDDLRRHGRRRRGRASRRRRARSTGRGARRCRRRRRSCRPDDRARARARRARCRARSPRTRAPASARGSSARRARRGCGRSSACGGAPSARAFTAARSASSRFRIRSHASRSCSASAVSTTSDEVRPKCSQRASGPTRSATAVVKAMMSCLVTASMASIRATSNGAPLADRAGRVGGDEALARPSPRPPRSRPSARSA